MADDKKPAAPDVENIDTDALLRAKLKQLCDQRDAINAALAPDRAKCDQVHIEIQALYDTIAPLGEKIKAQMPALQKIENDIAKIAVSLGGKRMSDAPPAA